MFFSLAGRRSTRGLGIFAAIAERLRADNIACVAVQRPAQGIKSEKSVSQRADLLVALAHAG